MKRIALLVLLVALSGVLLTGCRTSVVQPFSLVATPDAGYPPLEVTLTAVGQSGGSYTFQVDGQTHTQRSPVLVAWVDALPCEASVVWEGTGGPHSASTTIGLANEGPVIGPPVLNGIRDLWTIHPKGKYIVTFPDTYDREGGPVTLVDVTVYHTGQQMENTVFCPPYTGAAPPKPDLYRVRTGQGDIFNAFLFWSIWNGPLLIEGGSYLPYTPPGQAESGYPGASVICGPAWPRNFVHAEMTIITATFEDEMGARTTESWEIPTMQYPGC